MTERQFLDIKDNPGGGMPNLLLVDKKKHPTGRGSTFRPEPSSALLRAKAFIPQLASANVALEERLKSEPAESVNVEHIEGDEANVIEMNVALYEESGSDEEATDNIDESDNESDSDQPMFSEVSETNIKLPSSSKSKSKPTIEVISGAEQIDVTTAELSGNSEDV